MAHYELINECSVNIAIFDRHNDFKKYGESVFKMFPSEEAALAYAKIAANTFNEYETGFQEADFHVYIYVSPLRANKPTKEYNIPIKREALLSSDIRSHLKSDKLEKPAYSDFKETRWQRITKHLTKQKVYKIACALLILLGCVGIVRFKNSVSDTMTETKKTERLLWDTNRMKYDSSVPSANLAHDVATEDGGDVEKWCGELGGDTAKVRKIFLESMKALYSHSRYKRSSAKMEFDIVRNTLYIYSLSVNDGTGTTAWTIQRNFYQYFTDCDFDTVICRSARNGRIAAYQIYTRGAMRYPDLGVEADYPRLEDYTWWEQLWGTESYQKKWDRWRKALREYEKRHDYKDGVRAKEYRAKFIAHKDSLYNQRKNK